MVDMAEAKRILEESYGRHVVPVDEIKANPAVITTVHEDRTKTVTDLVSGEVTTIMDATGAEIPDPNPIAIPLAIQTREMDMFQRMKVQLATEFGLVAPPSFDPDDPDDDFDEDDDSPPLTVHEIKENQGVAYRQAKAFVNSRKRLKKDKKKDFKEGLSSMNAESSGDDSLVQQDGGASEDE